MEHQSDAPHQLNFLLLTLQLHIDEWQLSPLRTPNQRATALRRYFPVIEQSLLHHKHSTIPQLFGNREAKLEIFQVLDIDHIFTLYLTPRELVGPQLVLLTDVQNGLLGGSVYSEQITLETRTKELEGTAHLRRVSYRKKGIGVVGDKGDLSAQIW